MNEHLQLLQRIMREEHQREVEMYEEFLDRAVAIGEQTRAREHRAKLAELAQRKFPRS